MKIFLSVIFLCTNIFYALSQNIAIDTIKIKTVNITVNRIKYLSETEKTTSINHSNIERYYGEDLANFISKMSLASINTNGGLGALASISMRGSSATNTSVNWNGISLNSLTTGIADMSVINVGAFSDIDIIYGASGSIHGNGTYGGAIELYNKANWKKNSLIGINKQIGSFGNEKNYIYTKLSNKYISYNAQAFYNYGKNNFKYTDNYDFGHPRETATHNQNKTIGFIQDVHLNLHQHFISLGTWYQFKKKNIAGTMGIGAPVSNQVQRDSSLRVFASWKHLFNKVQVEYRTAWIYDYLRYTDKKTSEQKNYDIYSEIITRRLSNEINARYYISNILSIDFKGDYKTTNAKVAAYNKNIYETDKSISVSAKYTPSYAKFVFSISKQWNNISNSPLMYSLSSKLKIIDNKLKTRLKYSTNYRRPTLNEKYWKPGGNINLKSEKGRVFEIALIFQNADIFNHFSLDINYFNAQNDNSIIWMPGESFWSPQNTGGIYNHGIETEAKYAFFLKKIKNIFSVKYAYNNSFYNDKSKTNYKNKLPYTSTHTIRAYNNINYKKLSLGVIFSYQSNIRLNNNASLAGNNTLDLSSSYKFKFRKISTILNLRVDNALNKSYEIARTYPMPGRYINLGVNLTLKK